MVEEILLEDKRSKGLFDQANKGAMVEMKHNKDTKLRLLTR